MKRGHGGERKQAVNVLAQSVGTEGAHTPRERGLREGRASSESRSIQNNRSEDEQALLASVKAGDRTVHNKGVPTKGHLER